MNIYDYINNIYIYDKGYMNIIGVLSNQGANPQAPFYDDLYIQELDTGADTFQFSTISTSYTQDLLEIGNHVGFHYNNRFEWFTITSLEYSHYEGYKTISVYAEGIGFELLDVFMERPKGNGYSSGNDSDGDGDDNTDNEYADPDDMYLDENGIIIYDKDGSSRPKEEDIYVDGNGIITYKPNKRNNKNDSLEFKNISYPTFLNILLKNTGWKIECQPGLESVKHNISVKYDTNIYAILQDSMQAYRGVELEFVHESISQKGTGKIYTADVKKVIKAYKDGGRGSFVGKRFEYGTNVRGITKTQEVTDSEDDTVIRVDNVGVDVYYDIDFALKSAEIPEIEIGDTHYVIDRQFCPPMTIKARIGRIEVSFSDPTRNKITVANNKKIRGSAVDEEDIKDTVKNLDDTISDTISDTVDDITIDDDYIKDVINDNINDIIVNGHEHSRLVAKDDDSLYAEYSSSGLLPSTNGEQNLGIGSKRWKAGCINEVFSKGMETNRIESCLYLLPFDSDDMNSVKQITDSSSVSKQDLLDFITKEIKVYEYIYTGDCNPDAGESGPLFYSLNYLGVLSKDFKSNAASLTMNNMTNNDGTVTHNAYNLPSLVTALIGAFQQHVANHGTLGLSDVFEVVNGRLHIKLPIDFEDSANFSYCGLVNGKSDLTGVTLLEAMTIKATTIKFDDGTVMTTAGGSGSDYIEADYADIAELYVAVIGNNPDPMNEQYVEFRADIMMPGYTITAKDYNKPSDKSLKENIRYIDDTVMATSDDLLDKADLHDFIVNQVNLCEYNFIGDDSNKIGFIANDYEGTKVGDKIISRNGQNNTLTYNPDNLLFATIGALQEEVRMRDEKIASLEARLARIEEMLNNK